jgi:hypothetical protein
VGKLSLWTVLKATAGRSRKSEEVLVPPKLMSLGVSSSHKVVMNEGIIKVL